MARKQPGLEILKQLTLICWPQNQFPFTTPVEAWISSTRNEEFAILGDKYSLFLVAKLSGSCLLQLSLQDWLGCVLGYRYSCVHT